MLNYENIDLLMREGATVDLTIQYAGGSLDGSDFRSAWTLEQGICSENSLVFGSFMAGKFTVAITNTGVSLLNQTLTLRVASGDSDKLNLGQYTVKEETLSADRKTRQIVAYDALYDVINAKVWEWYDGLLPDMDTHVTLAEFRNSFFQHFGISCQSAELVNDSMDVIRTIEDEGLTGKDVLKYILEINGCFGLMSQGTFKYVFLGEPALSVSRFFGATDEGFTTDEISKIQIRGSENDIGAIFGSGDNCYIIEANPLLYGKSQAVLTEVATNLYGVIHGVQYTPATLRVKGNPCVECGDGYTVTTKRGTYTSYVLQRTLTGKRSLKDQYAADGTKQYAERVNSANRSITRLRGKTNELVREVGLLSSTITDLEEHTESRFMQTDQAITAEVTRATGAESGLSSRITQTADAFQVQIQNIYSELDGSISLFNVTEVPTLYNYPAYNFNVAPVLDGTWILDNGPQSTFRYSDEGYRKWTRSVAYDDATGISYRFRNIGGVWGWEIIADAEYSLLMEQISELKVEAGEISARVEENYASIGNLDETTKTLSSRVTQNATSITSEVSRATKAEGELGTKITQTADSITSEVNRATTAEGNLSTRVTQNANSISSEVSRATAAEGTLTSKITQTAEAVTTEVTRATKAEGNLSTSIKTTADGLAAEITRSKNAEGELSTSITATAEGINAEIKRAKDAESGLSSRISATASDITAEVKRATSAEDSLSGRITVTANEISSEVSRAKIEEGNLSSRITQTESSISSKVSKGSVISEINQTAESVTINAGRIDLQGIVNADAFTSKYATITALNAVEGNFSKLNASNITTGTLSANRIDIDGIIKSSKMEAKYATVSSLNAVSADVKTIKSNYITANYINATNISSALNSPTQGSIAIGSVSTSSFSYYSGSGYETLYPMNVTINGKVYRLFGHV